MQIKTISETNSLKLARRSALSIASSGEKKHSNAHHRPLHTSRLPANAMFIDTQLKGTALWSTEAESAMVANGLEQATLNPLSEAGIDVNCCGDGVVQSCSDEDCDGESEKGGNADVTSSVCLNGNGEGNSQRHAWKQRSAVRKAMGGPRHLRSEVPTTDSVVFVRNRRVRSVAAVAP
jgi:hypothetical protein